MARVNKVRFNFIRFIIISFSIYIILDFHNLKSAIVGSDSVVAVEGPTTFPEADNGTN